MDRGDEPRIVESLNRGKTEQHTPRRREFDNPGTEVPAPQTDIGCLQRKVEGVDACLNRVVRLIGVARHRYFYQSERRAYALCRRVAIRHSVDLDQCANVLKRAFNSAEVE